MFQLVEYPILNVVIDICFIFMSLALALCIYYVIVGPQPSERIISADAISCNVMVLIVLYSIIEDTMLFMPCVLVVAILGFIGMIAMSKYLAHGNIVYPMFKASQEEFKEVRHECSDADRD